MGPPTQTNFMVYVRKQRCIGQFTHPKNGWIQNCIALIEFSAKKKKSKKKKHVERPHISTGSKLNWKLYSIDWVLSKNKILKKKKNMLSVLTFSLAVTCFNLIKCLLIQGQQMHSTTTVLLHWKCITRYCCWWWQKANQQLHTKLVF